MGLFHGIRRELLQFAFLLRRGRRIDACVVGRAELCGQLAVVLTWILAAACCHLRGEKIHDGSVLVGGTNCYHQTQKTRAGTLFTPETVGTPDQAWYKPFE